MTMTVTMTMRLVTLDELDDGRHGAHRFDWVGMISLDPPNGTGEPLWQNASIITPPDPQEPMPTLRCLTVVASDPDTVRRRLRELGYDEDGF